MQRVRDLNVNTRQYWNDVYCDLSKRIEYVEDKPFHHVRFEQALELVENGWKVLDIGCGVGNFTKRVKAKFPSCEVWGTDISDAMIEVDKKESPEIKYLYQKIGNQKDVPDNYFDLVFSGEVLEHLESPDALFVDAFRVLKPGGIFEITTPFSNWVDSAEHVWAYGFDDIEKLYTDNGFEKPTITRIAKEYFMTIFAYGKKI